MVLLVFMGVAVAASAAGTAIAATALAGADMAFSSTLACRLALAAPSGSQTLAAVA
jgi:hypothetical protein